MGPGGAAYGLDLSADMTCLARQNAARAGVDKARFVRGDLPAIPLRTESVDVVISNGVIDLRPDKVRALREAFRVLKPGGRLAVSDVIVDPDLAGPSQAEFALRPALGRAGCLAGALTAARYRALLENAGFCAVDVPVDYRSAPEDPDCGAPGAGSDRPGQPVCKRHDYGV